MYPTPLLTTVSSILLPKLALVKLLRDGINKERTSTSATKWKKLLNRIKHEKDRLAPSELTDIFTVDGSSGGQRDREFALLLSTKTQYISPSPELTLGTIVADDHTGNTEYFVCVQPKCDCVRISANGRHFPFLPLVKVNSGDFGYVVKEKSDLIDLKLKIKPQEFIRFCFKPAKAKKPVIASWTMDKWLFISADDPPIALRWVAELKGDHAQRVANDFAHEISRVGLTESEWLRRSAKKEREP